MLAIIAAALLTTVTPAPEPTVPVELVGSYRSWWLNENRTLVIASDGTYQQVTDVGSRPLTEDGVVHVEGTHVRLAVTQMSPRGSKSYLPTKYVWIRWRTRTYLVAERAGTLEFYCRRLRDACASPGSAHEAWVLEGQTPLSPENGTALPGLCEQDPQAERGAVEQGDAADRGQRFSGAPLRSAPSVVTNGALRARMR
jgi:hypothetical protein